MKLMTFYTDSSSGQFRFGVSTERGVLDVTAIADSGAWAGLARSLAEVFTTGPAGIEVIRRLVDASLRDGAPNYSWTKLRLAPCVANPGKIICVGTDRRKHAEESGMEIPVYPVLFNKFANTVAAHGEDIPLPASAEQIDYEAELVMVIGKRAKHIPRERGLEYMIGYCAVNDLSARDQQFRTNQWLLGKSCDHFSPLGPYLVG